MTVQFPLWIALFHSFIFDAIKIISNPHVKIKQEIILKILNHNMSLWLLFTEIHTLNGILKFIYLLQTNFCLKEVIQHM